MFFFISEVNAPKCSLSFLLESFQRSKSLIIHSLPATAKVTWNFRGKIRGKKMRERWGWGYLKCPSLWSVRLGQSRTLRWTEADWDSGQSQSSQLLSGDSNDWIKDSVVQKSQKLNTHSKTNARNTMMLCYETKCLQLKVNLQLLVSARRDD